MLPYKNRIVKKEDILRIKRYGRSYFSGNIELRVAETRLEEARIGFVVGARSFNKAVERNQIKRWMREFFRSQLPELKRGRDMLVIVRKKEQQKIQKEKVKQNLEQATKQAEISV